MFIDNAYLIPALPLLAFAIIGMFVPGTKTKLAHSISIGAILLSTVCAVMAALELAAFPAEKVFVIELYRWLPFASGANPEFAKELFAEVGILVDRLSILLALVVCIVSLLVQIYSTGYMAGHSGYRRFFAYISLFSGAMLGLVLSSNLLQTYAFWELVGLGSFLLIGFYFEKPSAVAACKKAFIVTRFADLGFLVGVLLISFYAESFSFSAIAASAATIDPSIVATACALIAMGAFGKSAMFPLHVWLPDAMEGPSPVSALIHAATMVVAGVYLIARLFPLYAAAPDVLQAIAYVGAFTSLFAAAIACTQFDIKRVLAYSTLSQIGYMMLSLGVARDDAPLGFTASMFHLTTHAFFKALLFLCAGAIIHAVHTNDMREMGKLRKSMPVTHWTFLIGCLAISALPPFLVSGFFSKEMIFSALLDSHNGVLLWLGIAVAGLTTFYMFRLYYSVFWSNYRSEDVHAPSFSMRFALVVLAIFSIFAGYLPFDNQLFFEIAKSNAHHATWLPIVATSVSVLGLVIAHVFYFKDSTLPKSVFNSLGALARAAYGKFYIDEVYNFVTHRVIFRGVCQPLEAVDRRAVDGNVDRTGAATQGLGSMLRTLSTGELQIHAAAMIFGCILVGVLFATWLV